MASADALAGLLLGRAASLGSSRLLAIDGWSGSGKSTLAVEVVQALLDRVDSCALVSLDDLYAGWTGLDVELEARVRGQLLDPLAAGASASYQVYDWTSGTMGRWHPLGRPSVVVFEGCGAGAVAYSPFVSLLVWVEAGERERHQRALERDGVAVLPHLEKWWALESEHFRLNDTRARADVILDTSAVPD